MVWPLEYCERFFSDLHPPSCFVSCARGSGLLIWKSVNYDEDRDGFSFARRKRPVKKRVSREIEHQPTTDSDKHGRGRPSRRKRTSAESQTSEGEPAQRRRSARLSGENGPAAQRDEQASRAKEVDRKAQRAKSPIERDQKTSKPPPTHGDELHVEKKRNTTKIALPFADTPVITRNKEMRKTSSEGRRRSSSGMRGRRASSLIDSGVSNGETDFKADLDIFLADARIAVPHNDIKTEEFYKHISQDLPEPRRMMQLLTWCGVRAVSDRPSDQTSDVNAILAGMMICSYMRRDFC